MFFQGNCVQIRVGLKTPFSMGVLISRVKKWILVKWIILGLISKKILLCFFFSTCLEGLKWKEFPMFFNTHLARISCTGDNGEENSAWLHNTMKLCFDILWNWPITWIPSPNSGWIMGGGNIGFRQMLGTP